MSSVAATAAHKPLPQTETTPSKTVIASIRLEKTNKDDVDLSKSPKEIVDKGLCGYVPTYKLEMDSFDK